jgi:hypothetical protein
MNNRALDYDVVAMALAIDLRARLVEAVNALADDYTGPDIPSMWRAGYDCALDAAKDALHAALAAPGEPAQLDAIRRLVDDAQELGIYTGEPAPRQGADGWLRRQ